MQSRRQKLSCLRVKINRKKTSLGTTSISNATEETVLMFLSPDNVYMVVMRKEGSKTENTITFHRYNDILMSDESL